MKTTNQQLNIYRVLEVAIGFIDQAADETGAVSAQTLKDIYNSTSFEDYECGLTADEFSLANTIAIGAITEQNGSNIQAVAAMANLQEFFLQ
jgi:hypothetical protein